MSNELGCLIVDIAGTELCREDINVLQHPLVGGVILFARNYECKAQLTQLCRQIRAARKQPLLLMVDQEGGRVQRFINQFTRLPYMGYFGALYDKDPALALEITRDCGWLMATEVLAMGIDLSLAPILDLDKGVSTVIGKRAFHADSTVVTALAKQYVLGMNAAGMTSVGKHFPGHGSVAKDSHVMTPVDPRDFETILASDLQPFIAMVNDNINGLMMSHIVFPEIDDLPVGYSHRWVSEILRERLGFSGVIFSDDLNMEGANISSDYSDRVLHSRSAGIDFTLLCNNRPAVIQVLDELIYQHHQVNEEKWRSVCGNFKDACQNANSLRFQQIHQVVSTIRGTKDGSS